MATRFPRPPSFDLVSHPLVPATASWNPQALTFNCLALPPLPSLDDSGTLSQIWPRSGSATERQNLAWEGDAVLQLAATMHLLRGKDRSRVGGPICRMRETILSNNTWSYLAISYRLVPHAPIVYCDQKSAADVFEAYIGAFHRQATRNGTAEEVDEWLSRLFSPTVWPDLNDVEAWLERKHSLRTMGDRRGKSGQGIKAMFGLRTDGGGEQRSREARMMATVYRKQALAARRAAGRSKAGDGGSTGNVGSDGSGAVLGPDRNTHTSTRTSRFPRASLSEGSRHAVIDLTASDGEDDDIVLIDSLPTITIRRIVPSPNRKHTPESSIPPRSTPNTSYIDLTSPIRLRPSISSETIPLLDLNTTPNPPRSPKASRSSGAVLKRLLKGITNAFSPSRKTGAQAKVVALRKGKMVKSIAARRQKEEDGEQQADPGQVI